MTASWMPWLQQGDPNAGSGVAFSGMPHGLLAPMGAGPPQPFMRKPSIVDRVAARLFPMGQYQGLLDPDAQAGVQRQGLMQLGQGLLQQSGPSTQRIGLGQALGNALGGVNIPEMAHQALQLQAAKAHAARQQELQKLGAGLATSGADPAAVIRQAMPLFLDDPETLKALAEAAKSLAGTEPRNLQEVKGIDNRLGSRTIGQKGTYLLQPGTNTVVDFIPEGQDKKPLVDPSALWTDAKARLEKWTPVQQAIDQYKQFRGTASTPASDSALLAASQALTNVHGGYPDEGGGLEHVPEIGKLFKMLQALGGSQKLTPTQRADLVTTTDAVVRRLESGKATTRRDIERQLRRAGFSSDDLQTFLPGPAGGGQNILDQP